VGTDDGRVAYCAMLDSVESCSSFGSKLILASPPLILDLHTMTELLLITEVPEMKAAEQEAPEGWFS
jgi:hypothetical protein